MKKFLLVIWSAIFFLVGCQPQPEPVTGAEGIGDPYYPSLGNGGYDVQKYTIILDVDPQSNTVEGKTIIKAKAIQGLKSLNLDFQGLVVDSVLVNDSPAGFSLQAPEMTINPSSPLPLGRTFTVEVSYHGEPITVESLAIPAEVGWFHSEDGTINVLGEPDGASTWFPNNNHPRDKALYHLEIKVPDPWVVAATGTLKNTIKEGNSTRYIVELNDPAATYLVAINIGKYLYKELKGPKGILIRSYFPPDYPDSYKSQFDQLPEMLEYLISIFGPYPFKEYGVVIASSESSFCSWAGADETQTLSVHCPIPEMAGEYTIVHELAHQWFGDSVSLENWKDIWLKEGMATYAELLWRMRDRNLDELNNVMRSQLVGYYPSTSTGEPPSDELYRDEVYTGGALVFHALRLKLGDETFFKILRTYLKRYRGSSAGTDEFIALSEEISGQNLREFFKSWLDDNKLPEWP